MYTLFVLFIVKTIKVKIMSQFIDSEKNHLTVLTYNTHLFGGSNADYANLARIEITKIYPGIIDKYPTIFKNIPNIIYEDDERAQYILNNVKDSGVDIVALQEVWGM